MVLGVLELHLALYDNSSLKAKRSVVKRVSHRCRGTFNVSVAEIEDQDMLDRAVLAVVAVGSDRRVMDSVLDKIVHFVERMAIADVVDSPRSIENW